VSARFVSESSRVNALFTMAGYGLSMNRAVSHHSYNLVRLVLTMLVAVLAIASLAMPQVAKAQSATIDWANAGVASQATFPSGTVVTGSDGTTATVTRTVTTEGAGTFLPAFAPDYLSYFSGTIGGAASPLLLSFDNSSYDPRDKITVTIVLNRSVRNLSFSLGDIDLGDFADAVEVYYDDDLSGAFSNAATNTAFWTLGSAVARTNNSTVNGWRGTANSETAATNGNVNLNFGTQQVRRIRIVYFSYTGTGDPTGQFAGISDLVYSPPGADLSLSKALIGSPPVQGGTAVWRLVVTNNSTSTDTATNVIVRDTYPTGFTFSSASGDGSYNSSNRQWTIPSLAPGESATLTLSGTISSSAGTIVTNVAEIIASSVNDPDSTVNNGVTSEDDYATASFTVQSGRSPGVPPVLSCPAGRSTFDWDTISGWSAGSVDNSFAFGGFGNVRFQLTNNGTYVSNAVWGGNTPNVSNYFNGGIVPAENVLQVVSDQSNLSGAVTITITLPRAFTGVQFSIFDVDFGANQFADRLIVSGSNGGASVNPVLTNGNVNYVSGNQVIGDGAAPNDQATGNVVITFTQAVDRITIQYGNHTTAPSNPGQQGIGLHDITVCDPFAAMSVSKVSSVISDPVNATTNPKAIPGALIEYLITVSNAGPSATDSGTVIVRDDGPADAKMCLISRSGGPVIFAEPSGTSGLTYSFLSLGSATDNLEFSNDNGATFTYTPSADGQGCDTAITNFRVRPGGALSASRNFTLTVRYIIE
jgi:uncharacterized repeat protein (TIGR01451 family)